MSPAKIVYWYDRRTRNWVTQLLDSEGNQIDDAIYDGDRVSLARTLAWCAVDHPDTKIEKLSPQYA